MRVSREGLAFIDEPFLLVVCLHYKVKVSVRTQVEVIPYTVLNLKDDQAIISKNIQLVRFLRGHGTVEIGGYLFLVLLVMKSETFLGYGYNYQESG